MSKDKEQLIFRALYILLNHATYGDIPYEGDARKVIADLKKHLPPTKDDEYSTW